MTELIKSVISSGGYKLTEIRQKIKKLYLTGDISEEEADFLLAMAAKGVSADAERPPMTEIIHTLAEEIATLKSRVDALEGMTEEPIAYPLWKPWDGISKDYAYGAIVSHNGALWESVFEGQNVWEPCEVNNTLWKIHEA